MQIEPGGKAATDHTAPPGIAADHKSVLIMSTKRFTTPFILPVLAFAAAILAGSALLAFDFCARSEAVSFVDALFTATSSVCVTGLASVDPSTVFNHAGHVIMLALIQLGGLGIATYATLIFYLFARKVSLSDRLAVGQALLREPSFNLGRFLLRIVSIMLVIECAGAVALYAAHPEAVTPFHALFLSVSAFCNAGFALWPDNLIQWKNDPGVNGVVIALIILGGLGFAVLDELIWFVRARLVFRSRGNLLHPGRKPQLSYHSRLVLKTSCLLVLGGGLVLFCANAFNPAWEHVAWKEMALQSLFQSVTCRTAGFSTVNLAYYTDLALLAMIVLMVIGGSPGSCAGGIKTTTFRALFGFFISQIRGRSQVVVQGRAMGAATMNRVMVLFFFSMLTLLVATAALILTENGSAHHNEGAFTFLELFFEAASAFGTVGLSINVTPQLTAAGKVILCLVMFIGRLGPIWLITAIAQLQREPAYRLAETELNIG